VAKRGSLPAFGSNSAWGMVAHIIYKRWK